MNFKSFKNVIVICYLYNYNKENKIKFILKTNILIHIIFYTYDIFHLNKF